MVQSFCLCYAQEKVKRLKVLPVPSFGYSVETDTYVGFVSLFTLQSRDSLTRSSNFKLEFNYTWNDQIIVETDWRYFSVGERWFSRGFTHFSKYPDLYYGIGPQTLVDNEVNFESNRIRLEVDLLKQIGGSVFVGGGARYHRFSNTSVIEGLALFDELKDATTGGLRLIALKDTRSNLLTPTSGVYAEFVGGLNVSDKAYGSVRMDFRKYYSFNEAKRVLSVRAYNAFVVGTPPFYDYSLLGGDRLVRGYLLGRYRDRALSTLQLEYRTHLLWRIGVAAFGGTSWVYDGFQQLNQTRTRPNLGLGLRFLVDQEEGTNLRFDYAIGSGENQGFYVSFGESF